MNIDEIIKQVAKVHNTTPEEVYAEMQIALDAAFQSKDPEVQKEWAKIPFKGDHPTPEDVIPYLVGQLKNPQVAVSCRWLGALRFWLYWLAVLALGAAVKKKVSRIC